MQGNTVDIKGWRGAQGSLSASTSSGHPVGGSNHLKYKRQMPAANPVRSEGLLTISTADCQRKDGNVQNIVQEATGTPCSSLDEHMSKC